MKQSTTLEFSSGRAVYTQGDVFGLSPFGMEMNVILVGSDGELSVGLTGDCDLLPADAVELADAMIARWQSLKKAWTPQD